MTLRPMLTAAAVTVIPFAAFAQSTAATEVMTQTYACERGAQVSATYINAGDQSFAVVAFEGRQIGFAIDTSASGARYVSTDPAQPFVWWTKGDTAMLMHGTGDAEAMVYASCAAAS
ncbi:MAG: MliC family protein [Gemmobacter sp.]